MAIAIILDLEQPWELMNQLKKWLKAISTLLFKMLPQLGPGVYEKMKNNLDVAKLIKTFGTKKDFCFGINTGEFDLFTYVQKELGNDFGGITNYRIKRINEDWRKKGITYQL